MSAHVDIPRFANSAFSESETLVSTTKRQPKLNKEINSNQTFAGGIFWFSGLIFFKIS